MAPVQDLPYFGSKTFLIYGIRPSLFTVSFDRLASSICPSTRGARVELINTNPRPHLAAGGVRSGPSPPPQSDQVDRWTYTLCKNNTDPMSISLLLLLLPLLGIIFIWINSSTSTKAILSTTTFKHRLLDFTQPRDPRPAGTIPNTWNSFIALSAAILNFALIAYMIYAYDCTNADFQYLIQFWGMTIAGLDGIS